MARIEQGDCLEKLVRVPTGSVDLAVLDPPYNLGMDYHAYEDNQPQAEYLSWVRRWLDEVRRCLRPSGSAWFFINPKLSSEVDTVAKDLGLRLRNKICWSYTFGQAAVKGFTTSHTEILYYVKSDDFYFDGSKIKVPSARQAKYKDKRAKPGGKLPDDTWVLFPEQLPEAYDPSGDVWLHSRVCGTYKERETVSPNQLPIPLVERIVLCSTKPGDVILDCFLGSGTSAVVAARHGREIIGFDLSEKCIQRSKERYREEIERAARAG